MRGTEPQQWWGFAYQPTGDLLPAKQMQDEATSPHSPPGSAEEVGGHGVGSRLSLLVGSRPRRELLPLKNEDSPRGETWL